MNKKYILTALMGILVAGTALADSATSNFQTNASINSSCIVSANNVSFGTITPATSGNLTANGSISSTCTKTTAYGIEIYFDSELSDNRMFHTDAITSGDLSDPTTQLTFQVGMDDSSSRQKNLTGTGLLEVTQVKAEIPLNQYVKPGVYTSTVFVMLTY